MIIFYCPSCEDFRYVGDFDKVLDELNNELWSNLVCQECGTIVATIKSDTAGPFTMEIESDESGNEVHKENPDEQNLHPRNLCKK